MANNAKVLDALLVKVDRAYKHILHFQLAITRFHVESCPSKIFPEDNLETGERSYYLRILKEMPSEFPAFIGDILQNLRSALDHLASHLVETSPVTPKAKKVYFPIFESSAEYTAGKMGKIQGMTQAAINAIDAIEPYYRLDGVGIGKGTALWWLQTMNNMDKHRLLIPAWICPTGHSLTKSKKAEWETVLKSAFPNGVPDSLVMAANFGSGILQDGSKLCTLPISQVEDDMQFRLHIAFGEPAGVRGKEVLSTLLNMHRIVRQTIIGFDEKNLL